MAHTLHHPPDATVKRIARRVKQHRTALGWSQEELGRRAGYTRQGIQQIEACLSGVSGPGLRALAAALGVETEALTSPRRTPKA